MGQHVPRLARMLCKQSEAGSIPACSTADKEKKIEEMKTRTIIEGSMKSSKDRMKRDVSLIESIIKIIKKSKTKIPK